MDSVDQFLRMAQQSPGWVTAPAGAGSIAFEATDKLPRDAAHFLSRCGGVQRVDGISIGSRIVNAQLEILGTSHPDDRSADWFVIAESGTEATASRVVIDLGPDRTGRCYDAFWDCFGVAGSMSVIASSFSDLLMRMTASNGFPYWDDWTEDLGDAYD